MKVDINREILLAAIQSPQRLPGRSFDVTHDVWRWWNAYKEWEGEDTFKAAFEEKRLCITQRPDEENVTSTIKTSYDMQASRSTDARVPSISYPGVTYSVGVQSLAQRMDPANFTVSSEGVRRKYELGLFDLSASLLNPGYPTIKGQLRWSAQSTKKLWPVVFIPLPKPADVRLYHKLKEFAAAQKDPVLLGIVNFIRQRMTRPMLAAAGDIGAGPFDVAPAGSRRPKIKYGWKSNEGELTEETKQRAKMAATDYQEMIADAKPILGGGYGKVVASNELTIALRQRNGKRFPMITRFLEKSDGFRVDQPNGFFAGNLIPDTWRNTQEFRIRSV
jgi:hypothetical protein